jgi:hypothetical protein
MIIPQMCKMYFEQVHPLYYIPLTPPVETMGQNKPHFLNKIPSLRYSLKATENRRTD